MREKIVILGSSPAAYVAGIYAASSGLNPLIVEENICETILFTGIIPGLTTKDWVMQYLGLTRRQAQNFGVNFVRNEVSDIKFNNKKIELYLGKEQILTDVCIIDDLNILKRLKKKCKNIEQKDGIFLCGYAGNVENIGIVLAGSGCESAIDAAEYIESIGFSE